MSAVAALDEYLDGLLVDRPPPAPARAPTAVVALAPAPTTPAMAPRSAEAASPAPPALAAIAALSAQEPGLPHRRAADRSSRWLRLRCAGQAYGLELLKVQEVVLPTPLLPLRGTPPAMLGVMNLRGQVVPVLDLGVHLGQAPQPATAATRYVVLEEKGETLGLRVSAVEDVVNLTEQQIEAPDRTRAGRIHSDLFRGVARQSGDPVILLDASGLLDPARAGAR